MTDHTEDGEKAAAARRMGVTEIMQPEMFEPTDTMREEAAQWLVRLREPGERPVYLDFEAWKARSPAHEFAFAEMEALFEHAEPVAIDLAAQERKVQKRSALHPPHFAFRPRAWAVAASVILAVTVAFSQRERLVDLRSDAVTRAGATEQLQLADGSRVTLNTRTALKASFDPDRRGVRLYRGEAYFEVAKDASRPFVVQAGDARIRVVGTKFNVRMDHDQVVVTVDEGKVRLAPTVAPGRAIFLVAGQQAFTEAAAVQRQPAYDPTAAAAWRRRQVVFYDAPLAEVVDELNRYRPVPIVLIGGDLRQRKVSGAFNVADTDSAVRTVERTLAARTAHLAGVTVIY